MECKFCKNEFKTSSILKTHQQSAKYCLKIQNKNDICKTFCCEECGTKLTSRQRLSTHLQSCSANTPLVKEKISNLEKIIDNLKIENIELKNQLKLYKELAERELDCIESIAKQPKTTSNNQTNNLMMLTPLDLNDKESFSKVIKESFDTNYLLEGQKGVAKFAVDKLLKDKDGNLRYVCTDPSRQTYRFKAMDGTIERDIKAKKLTSAIAADVVRQSYNLSNDKIQNGDTEVFLLYSASAQDINDMSTDNGEFRNELASLTNTN